MEMGFRLREIVCGEEGGAPGWLTQWSMPTLGLGVLRSSPRLGVKMT